MKLLIINGPNLNLLGKREPEVYGIESLDQIILWVTKQVDNAKSDLQWFQSNSEGEIINKLHWAFESRFNGIIINPGAYTHYSYAIRDAISAIKIPTIEVHLSDINSREDFRKNSVIKEVTITQISGEGKEGYLKAINLLLEY
jgi:3-dehydroquinate dehydratase-2|tara:strand:+ start:8209 stop:8637 length:429 start_codon:yes stop_codon:yes gene_type:complete